MSDITEFRLPQLAASVTSVRLGVWLKQEGDRVQAGEPIAEVETDKTNVELEAPTSGVVRAIQVAAGTDGLEAGVLLAIIADAADGETAAPVATTSEPVPDDDQAVETDAGSDVADRPSGDEPAAPREPARPVQVPTPVTDDAPAPLATPMGRRMAAAAGLDLSTVRGTGRGGRVGKADIDRVLAARPGATPTPVADAAPAAGEARGPVGPDGPFREHTLTAMRRVTATRLQQAKQTVPHFYLRIECAVDAALGLLTRAKELHQDVKPTVTDFVVRAAALALRQVPQANSTWADGVVRVYDTVDIAVAVNTPKGLITPIVRAADRKDLGTIARETRALVTRARDGSLRPEEYTGARSRSRTWGCTGSTVCMPS